MGWNLHCRLNQILPDRVTHKSRRAARQPHCVQAGGTQPQGEENQTLIRETLASGGPNGPLPQVCELRYPSRCRWSLLMPSLGVGAQDSSEPHVGFKGSNSESWGWPRGCIKKFCASCSNFLVWLGVDVGSLKAWRCQTHGATTGSPVQDTWR